MSQVTKAINKAQAEIKKRDSLITSRLSHMEFFATLTEYAKKRLRKCGDIEEAIRILTIHSMDILGLRQHYKHNAIRSDYHRIIYKVAYYWTQKVVNDHDREKSKSSRAKKRDKKIEDAKTLFQAGKNVEEVAEEIGRSTRWVYQNIPKSSRVVVSRKHVVEKCERRQSAIRLKGENKADVARTLGVSERTVQRYWNE